MILSLMSVLLMGGLFLIMINKAQYRKTRRMAFLPLAVCLMEVLATGMLHPLDFPVLTLMLVALRVIIAGCCVGMLRVDAAAARRRAIRCRSERERRANVTAFPTCDSRRMIKPCQTRCA